MTVDEVTRSTQEKALKTGVRFGRIVRAFVRIALERGYGVVATRSAGGMARYDNGLPVRPQVVLLRLLGPHQPVDAVDGDTSVVPGDPALS